MKKYIELTVTGRGATLVNPAHIVEIRSEPTTNKSGAAVFLADGRKVEAEETPEEILKKIDELG